MMLSNYTTFPLGDYIDQIRGISYKKSQISTTPKEGYLPLLRANNIQNGKFTFINLIYVDKKLVKSPKKIKKGDIVIAASSGSKEVIGKAAQAEEDYEMSFGAFCKLIRAKENINKKYLGYFFKTDYYSMSILNSVNGSNINNIRNEHLNSLFIPIPPLNIQEKIVKILDKAQKLIDKRKAQIEALDQLIQSVFLEMFGDPVKNNRNFQVIRLGDYTSHVSSGVTPKGGQKSYLTEGIPFIRSQNVLMNRIDLNEVAYISKEVHESMKRSQLMKNDVLLNITGASIGRVAVYVGEDRKANVNQHVCIIRLLNDLNPCYLSYYIASNQFQNSIKALNSGATREALNYNQIKSFEIPLPPIELQNKFAEIVHQIESQKALLQQSLSELENIFHSLMQRAFKGELFHSEPVSSRI